MRNPTIRDVAKQAGVGIGTVSRVLNDSSSVSEVTRQKVLDAIQQLGFSPNQAARQLSGGKTWTIGVISPYFTYPSFVERLNGIQRALHETNYDLVLYSVHDAEHLRGRLLEIVTRKHVDGLILIVLENYEEDLLNAKSDLPLVMIAEAPLQHYPHLLIDNLAGGRMASDYLLQHDHTLLGFIGDELETPYGFSATRDRYEGFQQILAENELPLVAEWCQFGTQSHQSGYDLALQILSQPDRPTAIVASSDTIAFGVIEAAHHLHLRIPQDLAVIGFDDIPAARFTQLTTIRQELYQSGQLAAQKLMGWIEDKQMPRDFQTYLPLQVIQRRTV